MSKADRKKFGLDGEGALKGNRILVKELDPAHFRMPACSVLVIDTEANTVTSANVYGDRAKGEDFLGKNYSPEGMTHPLPAEGGDKWKKWGKEYTEGSIADFSVITSTVKAPAPAKAPKAPKAPTSK